MCFWGVSGSRDVFNLVRTAFLTITMVPKSKNLGSGSKSGQSCDFFDFFDFWDPHFPNSFRKSRSPMAPQGKPLCGKESHMDPLHVRFSSQTVESICFYKSNSTFSWKPCFLRSSVWGQFRGQSPTLNAQRGHTHRLITQRTTLNESVGCGTPSIIL